MLVPDSADTCLLAKCITDCALDHFHNQRIQIDRLSGLFVDDDMSTNSYCEASARSSLRFKLLHECLNYVNRGL